MATLADALRQTGFVQNGQAQPQPPTGLSDKIRQYADFFPTQFEANLAGQMYDVNNAINYSPEKGLYTADPESLKRMTEQAPNLAGMMIGPSSPLWNKEVAFKAAKMLKEGMNPADVWKQTLTGRGLDNQFRQEISDDAMRFNTPEIDKFRRMRNFMDVNDVRKSAMNLYDLSTHDKLRKAYPESNETVIFRGPSEEGGSTSPMAWDNIMLGVEPANYWFKKPDSIKSMRETLLHELQHNVQDAEGFAKGGNPQMFKEIKPSRAQQKELNRLEAIYQPLPSGSPERIKAVTDYFDYQRQFSPHGQYMNLAGEAEARMTAGRGDLDEAARRVNYPFERSRYGLDINPDEATIITEYGGPIITRKQMLEQLLKEGK